MMLKWHHLDSSRARSAKQDSVKKKTLELDSRSSLNSALFYRTNILYYIEACISKQNIRFIIVSVQCVLRICNMMQLQSNIISDS